MWSLYGKVKIPCFLRTIYLQGEFIATVFSQRGFKIKHLKKKILRKGLKLLKIGQEMNPEKSQMCGKILIQKGNEIEQKIF